MLQSHSTRQVITELGTHTQPDPQATPDPLPLEKLGALAAALANRELTLPLASPASNSKSGGM